MLLVLAFASFTTACDAGQDGWNCCEPKYRGHGWAYASGFDPITGFVNEMSCCPDSDGDGVPGCPTFDFISQQFYNSPDCDDGDIHIKGSCINHHIMSVKVLSNDSRVHWSTRQQKNPEELSILDLINLEIFWENKYGLIPGLIKLYVGLLNQTTGSIDYGKYPLPVYLPGGNASSSIISFSFYDIESANEDMIRTVDELGYLPIRLMPHLVFDGEISNGSFFYYGLSLTNCVHVSGDGKIKIVAMRGNSTDLTPSGVIYLVKNVKEQEFESIEPFASYKYKFSYYADIKLVLDNELIKEEGIIKYNPKHIELSSCKNANKYALFTDFTGSYNGYTVLLGRIIYLIPIQNTFMHEIGHAFCALKDEYVLKDYGFVHLFTNCAGSNPYKHYRYKGILYGDTFHVGCEYKHMLRITSPKDISPPINYHRPSSTSIMNKRPRDNRFNAVSCGYCMTAIKGGSPKSNWPECQTLNVIKKS